MELGLLLTVMAANMLLILFRRDKKVEKLKAPEPEITPEDERWIIRHDDTPSIEDFGHHL